MKKSVLFILSLLVFNKLIYAQEVSTEKKGYKYNNNFDLALSTSGNQFSGAPSWVKFHNITKKQRFKLGYGVRFTAQGGSNLYYTTAPAILTSKQKGPQVLFSETFPENIDTFLVTNSQNNSLNISINLQYTIKEKIDIGFNIDALGFTFGAATTGKYIAYQSKESGSNQTAKPTAFNVLLISDNDIGMLNSELYLRYWLNKRVGIRAGVTFIFTEYTTTNKLRLDNNRWRNKALMGMIGITFSPFR